MPEMPARKARKQMTKNCELCGIPATHFCECEQCREVAAEDDHGHRPDDILGDGRWLCDDCK